MQSPTIDNLTVSPPRLEEAEAQLSTLCELFDRVALRHSGVTLTYREMGRAVSSLARGSAQSGETL